MEPGTRERRTSRRLLWVVAIAAMTLMTVGILPAHATTPGKNGRIIFAMDKGSGAEIFSIKRDGTHLRKLTRVSGDALTPDWSPSGRRILFADDVNEGTASDLAIMHADGTHFRDLSHTGYRESPDFIPGGHHIVYGCDCGKTNGLFVSRVDGANSRRLTKSPFRFTGDSGPAVSPHGRTVSFVRVKKGERLQGLFAVNVNGSHLRMIVPYTFEVPFKNDWAPRGNHIVFTIYGDSPGGLSPNVATIRPDGTHMRILTHVDRPGVGAAAGSYSPNGRWIAFKIENSNTGTHRLMKMRPDGSDRTMIASLPASPRGIDWGQQPT
jgi:Tol biopolymer transport system component